MIEAILVPVIAALIVAAILGGVRWLSAREDQQKVRQATCRHDWRHFDEPEPGSDLVVIRVDQAECQKCGKRR
jgi:hypothetical protein